MQSRTAVLAVLADVVAVLVFAAIGRLSHAESDDLGGLLATAAPFLVGVAASWALPPVRRAPAALQAGLAVWLGAVLLGLLIRTLFTRSLPLTFVVVAAASLGVLLIGWRGLALLVARHDRSGSGAR